jgi:glutaredoxin
VYGRSEAPDFQRVRRFLEDRGVLFQHADVERDRANLERMKALSGQANAVVIEIGKKVIVGFDPAALERALP